MVLVRIPGAKGLQRLWDGPRKITKILSPTTVEVDGKEKVHLVRVKFFKKQGEECEGAIVTNDHNSS